MTNPSSEHSHAVWDLVAERLTAPGGLAFSRALELSGVVGGGASSTATSPPQPEQPVAIGPYEPAVEDGEPAFVREPFQGEDFMWWRPSFTREVLKPKGAGDPTRICVIGESAAAGMFYTPQYSPSLALSEALGSSSEVIDLTRNSMNASEVVKVAGAALQLRPDRLVIFAGNNWFAGQGYGWAGPAAERADYVEAAHAQGARGIVRVFQERVRRVARRTVEDVCALAERAGVEVVFVIPAVNLLWERVEPTPWLGAGRTKRWLSHSAKAPSALGAENWDAALGAARAMLELDDGCVPTSHRLAGIALLGLGRSEDAARELEAELACANVFDAFLQSVPGTPSFVRDEVQATAGARRARCVDLRQVFASHTGSVVDWSALFVDYCHLTPEGMRVAMTAVARAIDGETKAATFGAVDERVEAIARFYSAIYTAHFESRALPADAAKLSERIASALELSPSIVPFVQDWLRARNGALATYGILSTASHRVIGQSNNPFMDFAAVRGAGGVDGLAVTAISRALGHVGEDGAAALRDYLAFHVRELVKGVDLTEPVYVERPGLHIPWLKFESERETRRALPLYRSLLPESAFSLVCDGTRDVELTLLSRAAPGSATPQGRYRIALNGEKLAELPLKESWERGSLRIPATRLTAGINRLTIEWPAAVDGDDDALKRANERHLSGIKPDIFPVFGEIFSLKAKAC